MLSSLMRFSKATIPIEEGVYLPEFILSKRLETNNIRNTPTLMIGATQEISNVNLGHKDKFKVERIVRNSRRTTVT